jgi:hypothetical protein
LRSSRSCGKVESIKFLRRREMCTEGKIDKGGRDFTPDHRRLTIISRFCSTVDP